MADIRWQEAEGSRHAYLARAPLPNRSGDTVPALGHTEPVTVTDADIAPNRHQLGPIPTCMACDIAARLLADAPLWGYTREEIDSVLPQLSAPARARVYPPARPNRPATTPEVAPTPSGKAAFHSRRTNRAERA